MSDWKLTVGLEIHIELKTDSKMFCGCKNDPFASNPNSNVCPICYGLPGSLPVINKKAVDSVIKLGNALRGEIEEKPFWARKNYFYPDLPKSYQISQFLNPLVTNATMKIDGNDYHIARIHLEEDTAKLTHMDGNSLINFNRSGVPLMELVTLPDFHDSKIARVFCQELQRIVRSLGIAEADMEKGQMRCEANISVSRDDNLGTKVEIKNLNSFRSVEKSIEYEFERQTKLIDSGEKIRQETRSWVENKNQTATMRYKETASDYRYFPEPDLPTVLTSKKVHETIMLPDDKREALKQFGISADVVSSLVDKDLFETIIHVTSTDPVAVVEVAKLLISNNEYRELDVLSMVELSKLKKENGWTTEVFAQIIKEIKDGKSIEEVTKAYKCDLGSIEDIAKKVLSENQSAANDYKSGKEQALNFLVGKVMQEAKGKANITQVRDTMKALIQ